MNNNNYGINYDDHQYHYDVKSVGGITLTTTDWTAKITTKDIENYIQQKVDYITRRSTDENRIKITCRTMMFNKIYAPTIILLPPNTLGRGGKSKKDNYGNRGDIPKAFMKNNNFNNTKSTELNGVFQKILSPFMYTKADIAYLSDPHNRSRYRFSIEQTNRLRGCSKPKNFTCGGKNNVVLALDTIKILHSMLDVKGDGRSYLCNIVEVNKTSPGDAVYTVNKYIPDNYDMSPSCCRSIDEELSHMFMGTGLRKKK